MLLTISTTHRPATDLGYLLHKHPGRRHTLNLTFGKVDVVYTHATEEVCTAALIMDVDPVGLVRDRQGPEGEGGLLAQYVNDRPYVASSFLSVALAEAYGTALGGRSRERPELAEAAIPLTAKVAVVPSKGGEAFLRRLWEPLGYELTLERHPLDPAFPEWGEGRYFTLGLSATCRLRDLLSHLYVLMPVSDDDKHYWVGADEVEKLLRRGEGWLAGHPERELISSRYLKHRRKLVDDALARLAEDDRDAEDQAAEGESADAAEERLEKRLNVHDNRLDVARDELLGSGAKRVLDLGCGEGKLTRRLRDERQFTEIVGVDVSTRALEIAAKRLKLEERPDPRVKLLHGSLTYRDRRLEGYDAAAVVEVVEHLDPPRLRAFERVVWECARPGVVALTTPNRDYNVLFPEMPAGKLRHADHRFEWTRAEFREWAEGVAGRHGYAVRFAAVGPEDAGVGSLTQMAVFTKLM